MRLHPQAGPAEATIHWNRLAKRHAPLSTGRCLPSGEEEWLTTATSSERIAKLLGCQPKSPFR
jgi:hypothetical protein